MSTKAKWYNDPQVVGTMLLFWLPLGIYGMHKSETIEPKWKNLTYGTLGLACILLVMVCVS